MARRLQLLPGDLDDENHVWRLLTELLSVAEEEELDDVQRPPRLAWCYDQEIHTGGHLQFLVNNGGDALATIRALRTIGADHEADILETACQRTIANPLPAVASPEEFSAIQAKGLFHDLDEMIDAREFALWERLRRYIEAHRSHFIDRIGDEP